jgi:hypothetical protein
VASGVRLGFLVGLNGNGNAALLEISIFDKLLTNSLDRLPEYSPNRSNGVTTMQTLKLAAAAALFAVVAACTPGTPGTPATSDAAASPSPAASAAAAQ